MYRLLLLLNEFVYISFCFPVEVRPLRKHVITEKVMIDNVSVDLYLHIGHSLFDGWKKSPNLTKPIEQLLEKI